MVACSTIVLSCFVLLAASPSPAPLPEPARPRVVRIVERIERSDYQGDRDALEREFAALAPFRDDAEVGFLVRYWRGFAQWRRAVNGFNDSVDPRELEHDLRRAMEEVDASVAQDPGFVEAKIGTVACLGLIMIVNRDDPARLQQLGARVGPMIKTLEAEAPDNPRLLWVLGPIVWKTPQERGGGQHKAIEEYERGLELVRMQRRTGGDPLEPAWGEPELLMSLAWSHAHATDRDLDAAESSARAALELVPSWHYVKDILLPQILEAKRKHE